MPKASIQPEYFRSLTLRNRLPELKPHLLKPVERVSTGWPLLDRALAEPGTTTGGFVLPSLVTIGAEPKAGKSLWGQHVVQSWVQRGGWCLYWDLENGAKRFVRRLGWRLAQVASAEITRGLSSEEEQRMAKMIRWLEKKGARFAYQDTRRATPSDVEAWLSSAAMAMEEDGELDEPFMLVVDSLQKVPALPNLDRRSNIDTWIRALEEMRDAYNCVILTISELGRHQTKGHKAGGTGYKESGDIEYTVDLGMTFSAVGQGAPRSAYLDIWWDRDAAREARRVAKYTRVLPYYQLIEEPLRKAPPDE